jgi:hypothetical protein
MSEGGYSMYLVHALAVDIAIGLVIMLHIIRQMYLWLLLVVLFTIETIYRIIERYFHLYAHTIRITNDLSGAKVQPL